MVQSFTYMAFREKKQSHNVYVINTQNPLFAGAELKERSNVFAKILHITLSFQSEHNPTRPA